MHSFKGRIINKRIAGKSMFINLLSNNEVQQLYINSENEKFDIAKNLKTGTFISAMGEMFYTKTNHYTLRISNFTILHTPKIALQPVKENEESFSSFNDIELIRKYRYIQTIQNSNERNTFILRSKIIQTIRNFFIENDYLEVETPILQPIYGGAEAEPFITHHNTLKKDLYLRIAPELYLRRMIIGGYERVFEIGKNFRNEGMSNKHNPEFTFIEAYTSFVDYNFSMLMIRNLLLKLSEEFKKEIIYNDNTIDITNVTIIKYRDLVTQVCNVDVTLLSDTEIIHLFEEHVESTLIQPTFVYDFPASISPLALTYDNDRTTAQRFELYIGGMEIANAYSELNDVDQHIETMGEKDLDFINALSYGMPPCSGLGIGIDRLIMLFTNKPIRDIIYFPTT